MQKRMLQCSTGLAPITLGSRQFTTRWAVRLPKHLPSSKLCAASATLVFVPAMEPNFRLHNSCGARLARPSRARLGISVRKNFEPGWPLDISQRPFFEPGLCLARAAGCWDEPTYSHLSRFPTYETLTWRVGQC